MYAVTTIFVDHSWSVFVHCCEIFHTLNNEHVICPSKNKCSVCSKQIMLYDWIFVISLVLHYSARQTSEFGCTRLVKSSRFLDLIDLMGESFGTEKSLPVGRLRYNPASVFFLFHADTTRVVDRHYLWALFCSFRMRDYP